MKNTLEQEGLVNLDVGNTYQSDHVQSNGKIAISAIDHVYCSKNLAINIDVLKLANSSTDHVPVVAKLNTKPKGKKLFTREIRERSMKNFSMENWRDTLAKKDWNEVLNCQNLDIKVELYKRV